MAVAAWLPRWVPYYEARNSSTYSGGGQKPLRFFRQKWCSLSEAKKQNTIFAADSSCLQLVGPKLSLSCSPRYDVSSTSWAEAATFLPKELQPVEPKNQKLVSRITGEFSRNAPCNPLQWEQRRCPKHGESLRVLNIASIADCRACLAYVMSKTWLFRPKSHVSPALPSSRRSSQYTSSIHLPVFLLLISIIHPHQARFSYPSAACSREAHSD